MLNDLWFQDKLRDIVLLVFANKQDLPNTMNVVEITNKLGHHSFWQHQEHLYNLWWKALQGIGLALQQYC